MTSRGLRRRSPARGALLALALLGLTSSACRGEDQVIGVTTGGASLDGNDPAPSAGASGGDGDGGTGHDANTAMAPECELDDETVVAYTQCVVPVAWFTPDSELDPTDPRDIIMTLLEQSQQSPSSANPPTEEACEQSPLGWFLDDPRNPTAVSLCPGVCSFFAMLVQNRLARLCNLDPAAMALLEQLRELRSMRLEAPPPPWWPSDWPWPPPPDWRPPADWNDWNGGAPDDQDAGV